MALPLSLAHLLPVLAVSLLFLRYFQSPIKSIPGPWVAKFTDLWRLVDVWKGHADVTQRKLHKKHGDLVRLGPNCVSVADPSMIKTIYNTKKPFIKSAFYRVNDIVTEKGTIQTQFSTQDEQWRESIIRPVFRLYSMSNVLKFEFQADLAIRMLVKGLKEHHVAGFNAGKPCRIDDWMHFYAWDVIGLITFSRSFGFLEGTADKGAQSLLEIGEKAIDYFAIIGQMPSLDKFLDKNPIYQIGPPSFSYVANFDAQRMFARLDGSDGHTKSDQPDFLDQFLDIRREHEKSPDQGPIPDEQIISWLIINTTAGSDTTAVTLRSALYFVARSERVKKILQKELDSAVPNADDPVSWRTYTESLPYLSAVIKETMRLHPAVGLPLERIVPEEGLPLPDGRFLPGGTVVGMNASVLHYDERVFGGDAEVFKPERWLRGEGAGEEAESDGDFRERTARMNESDLFFGFGRRSCLGRTVAQMEVYKVIATLFRVFDFTPVNPDRPWSTRNSWFLRQWDMDMRIQVRSDSKMLD